MRNEKQKLKQLCTVRNILAVVWVLLLIALIASFFLAPGGEGTVPTVPETTQSTQPSTEETSAPTTGGTTDSTDGMDVSTSEATLPLDNGNGDDDPGLEWEDPEGEGANNDGEPDDGSNSDVPGAGTNNGGEPGAGTNNDGEPGAGTDNGGEPGNGTGADNKPNDSINNDGEPGDNAGNDSVSGDKGEGAPGQDLPDDGSVHSASSDAGNISSAGNSENSAKNPGDGNPAPNPEPLVNTSAAPTEAATAPTEPDPEEDGITGRLALLRWILLALLLLDTAAVVVLTIQISRLDKRLRAAAAARRAAQMPVSAAAAPAGAVAVGKLHNVGARPSQQDSFGVDPIPGGMFAVVADGMGGLSGGEKVSQKIVTTMLSHTADLLSGQPGNPLTSLVQNVNEEVNRMLGAEGQYKSGSTLVSVLVRDGSFHWISVGDSRIYLYRGGSLIQINQEHTYEQDLLRKAMDGQITFEQARSDPQRHRLTSFIGMGRLRYVDANLHGVPLSAGDRILLMSDGVFNTLPEQTIAAILAAEPDVQCAAQRMEEQILNARAQGQDNFTAVILGV